MATGKLAQHCFLFNVLIMFSCYICLKFKLPQGRGGSWMSTQTKKKCQVTKFPQNKKHTRKHLDLSSNRMARRNEVFHLDFNQDQGIVNYYVFVSPLTSDPVVEVW